MADDNKLIFEIDFDTGTAKQKFGKVEKLASNSGKKSGSRFSKQFNASAANIAVGNIIANTVTRAVQEVQQFVSESLAQFRKFEQGLVGVSKTTNITGQELEGLSARIRALSKTIPVSTDELLSISQAAGQLGVTGSSNILNFTETIAKLGSASDITGDRAATSLTRIINVSSESIDQIDELASVIVSLGNNFAASESEIVRMANEVSRSTAAFSVGSTEAVALGAAMRSLGIRAESGGSAVGRSFQAIDKAIREGGSSLRTLEKLTGQTGEQLRVAFEEDATEVFRQFIKGISRITEQGGSAAKTLNTMGLSGQELLKVIPPLAQNADLLGDSLRLANRELRNSTALNKEASTAFDTLNSDLIRAGNVIDDLQVNIVKALAPSIRGVTKDFIEMAGSITAMDIVTEMKSIGTAITTFVVAPVELVINLFKFMQQLVNSTAAEIVQAFGIMAGDIGEIITIFDDDNEIAKSLKNFRDTSKMVANDVQKDFNEAFNGILDFETATALQERINSIQTPSNVAVGGAAASSTTASAVAAGGSGATTTPGKEVESQSIGVIDAFDNMGSGIDDFVKKRTKDLEAMQGVFKQTGKVAIQGFGSGVGSAFSAFGEAVANGQDALSAFGDALLQTFGKTLSQLGQGFILQGIAQSLAGFGSGAALIAAGAALSIFGGALSASGGGETGGTAAMGAPAAGGSAETGFDDGGQIEDQVEREPETVVNLNVQGDILDNQDTPRRLAELLNAGFERENLKLKQGLT